MTKREETCPACKGSGKKGKYACPRCAGGKKLVYYTVEK